MVVSNAALELPVWLLTGVGLGVLFSGLVALAFVLGRRRFADGAAVGAGFGGDERRRREIRHYLEAIGEAYREEESVAGSTVAFYLPERELAITFDARAYFRIEEAGVDAVLLEHELPGANLGSRLPFETPTFGTREPSSGRATAAASAAGASSTGRGSSQGDPREPAGAALIRP